MNLYEEASFIVEKLSLEEKCKFCCGIDFWESFSKDELGIPSIMICDGPHGLRKEIKENLIFAIGVKVLVLTLSVLGVATMWQAVFADVGTTLITILNTLRILR